MENFGFQQDLQDSAFSISENSNNFDYTQRSQSATPHLLSGGHSSNRPKLSTSSSFNIPKNKTSNKYRRFSESFTAAQRARNFPSIEASDISSRDNSSAPRRASDDSTYRSHLPSDEFQPNNLKICSSHNHFHAPVLNNAQETLSVPSLCVSNSFLSSSPSISARQSSSLSKSIISDTSKNILKSFSSNTNELDSKNKYINLTPTHSYLNNCSEYSTQSLVSHHKVLDDSSVLKSFSQMIKSQNDVNKIMNRSTTLPAVGTKNYDYFLNQTSGIQTVSGTVAMFFPGYQPSSPKPFAENRQNMRRTSKMLRDSCQMTGERTATLKRRSILRGWKLQFIPSDHTRRRTALLCCVLLLGCALVIAASGLIVYMTTGNCIIIIIIIIIVIITVYNMVLGRYRKLTWDWI